MGGGADHLCLLHCVRYKALLRAPEAGVHFREEAVERFSGIITEKEEAVQVL